MKPILSTRTLMEVISDSVKLIFRNIRALTSVMIFSVMLPSLGVTYVYLRNSLDPLLSGSEMPYFLYVIFIISCFFLVLHINLVSAALVKAAKEGDPSNITSQELHTYFRKLYLRNFAIILPLMLILAAFAGVVILLIIGSPVVAVVFALLLGVFCVLYLMPLWLYAQRIYLTKDDCTMGEAFKLAGNDLADYYGATLVTLIVSNITSSVLQYMILVPFFILFFALGFAIEFDFENSKFTEGIMLIESVLLSFGLSYLYLFIFISMFLKSYDIEERRTGEAAISKIQKIGTVKESFFENEGEY